MDSTLSLETLSELSIALAGFSGLVGMVRTGGLHDWHPRARLAFWISLGWSVSALVLASVPSLLAPLGAHGGQAWNGIALAGMLAGLGLSYASRRLPAGEGDLVERVNELLPTS